jgi:acetyl-CoA carboxylase biotin carboxylase subunit
MSGFDTVLIANRSAVAARVIRAAKGLGLRAVAVYSEADAGAPYLAQADVAVPIGAAAPRESYLDQEKLIAAARDTGAQAIHPGYGFLSENAAFARRATEAGLTFIGPDAALIEAMGEKTRAREIMAKLGIPIGAGSGLLPANDADVTETARRIGYPVLVKPAAGGGGIGMLAARDEAELLKAVERSRSMAARSFGDAQVYLENLIEEPRHIEFQMIGDRHGNVRHAFERDCSLQRRHQKVIEEAPAPNIARTNIEALAEKLCGVLAELGYDSIGTVECLMAPDGGFRFLEMNTRLQVEHAVTEMVTDLDLVQTQIRIARGERLVDILPRRVALKGHAIEARVCAEDPKTHFPSPGKLERFHLPEETTDLRVETGYREGMSVTPFYDSLLAKVIARGGTREDARLRLIAALQAIEIGGVKSNVPFLLRLAEAPVFVNGRVHTGFATEAQRCGTK